MISVLLVARQAAVEHAQRRSDGQDEPTGTEDQPGVVAIRTRSSESLGRSLGLVLDLLRSGRRQDDGRLGLRLRVHRSHRVDGVDRIDRVHGLHRGNDLAVGLGQLVFVRRTSLLVGELPLAGLDEDPLTGLRVLALLDVALLEVVGGVLLRVGVAVDDGVAQTRLRADTLLGLHRLVHDRERALVLYDVRVAVAAVEDLSPANPQRVRVHREVELLAVRAVGVRRGDRDLDELDQVARNRIDDTHLERRAAVADPLAGIHVGGVAERDRDRPDDLSTVGRADAAEAELGDGLLGGGRLVDDLLLGILTLVHDGRPGVRDVGVVALVGSATLGRHLTLAGAGDDVVDDTLVGARSLLDHGDDRGVGGLLLDDLLLGLGAGCVGHDRIDRLFRRDLDGLDGRSDFSLVGQGGRRGEDAGDHDCRSGEGDQGLVLHEISSRRVTLR